MHAFRAAKLDAVQPPYNLFEREIEADVLPYAKGAGVTVLSYGALCRGLLSGRMTAETTFEGDDLRKVDPKVQGARFGQYLAAVEELQRLAQERFGKSVLAWRRSAGSICPPPETTAGMPTGSRHRANSGHYGPRHHCSSPELAITFVLG